MKTFEEALAILSVPKDQMELLKKDQDAFVANSGELRNIEDILRTARESEDFDDYLNFVVEVGLGQALNTNSAEAYVHSLKGFVFGQFIAGVRVGMEMEKQDIPAVLNG